MNAAAAALFGFWLGGLVASTGMLALEWPGVAGLPPVARVHPWRFSLAVSAMVLVWPAGLERIEATREKACDDATCPECGAELDDESEE